MSKIPVTVVILTLNEEIHIENAISNVIDWAESVFILDSGSNDKTCEIAESLGADIFFRKFDNYAAQRTYGIKELPIKTEWMLFLDADEYLTEELKVEISHTFLNSELLNEVNGFYLKRRFYFMGKWIKHGGFYPIWLLRLFKKSHASCDRAINEHINVKGKTAQFKHDFVDDNKKDFTEWFSKHNKYASFEAAQFDAKLDKPASFWGTQAERKKWIRQNIWNKMLPPLVRPFAYFFYIYFFRLGFLDGKVGFIYHFCQGLLYKFIIDVKYLEKKINSKI